MRDYQIAKQNVDTFYANEKNIRAEEELKKKMNLWTQSEILQAKLM